MKFRFNVNINDNDYYDFNKFHNTRSPYGKKQMTSIRIIFAVFGLLYAVFTTVSDGFDPYMLIALLIVFSLLIVFFPKLFMLVLKGNIKAMKKNGKMAYTPSSVMEFYDDFFCESAEETSTNYKYSIIEHISVVDNKVIYIHINSVMGLILPFASFQSAEQMAAFFEFIKTKCANIRYY